MSLSDDQQAMLQLVLERGQSYDDLAGVLGVGVDEVRSRARAAMTELAGEDPDAQVGLTDYLLGQADPIGRADAVRQLQNDPDTNRLAAGLVERLREVAPDAKLPDLPEARQRRRIPRPTTAPTGPAGAADEGGRPARDPAAPGREAEEAAGRDSGEAAGGDGGLSGGQQRAIVIAGAAALLVIAVVLAVSGVFGGGDDSAGSTTTTGSGSDNVLAEIPLKPQGGSDASGDATFGIQGEDQPYLDVQLSELSAPQAESSYVVWLLLSEDRGYPLTPIEVDGSDFSDRITIPQFAIPLASRARFVDVSLSKNSSLLGDLRQAVRDRKPILPYEGQSVLRGEIPAEARGAGAGGAGGASGGASGGG